MKCDGCGSDCGNHVVCVPDPVDPAVAAKADGLAKHKILQVNNREDDKDAGCTIFQYYTEYGDDGIVRIHMVNQPTTWVPFYALAAFVDFFRSQLGEQKESKPDLHDKAMNAAFARE